MNFFPFLDPYKLLLFIVILLPINSVIINILPVPWNDLWQPTLLILGMIGWFSSAIIYDIRLPKKIIYILIFVFIVILNGFKLSLIEFIIGIAVYLLYLPVCLWIISCKNRYYLNLVLHILFTMITVISLVGVIEYFTNQRFYYTGTNWSVWYRDGVKIFRLAPSIGWDTLPWATAIAMIIPIPICRLSKTSGVKRLIYIISIIILFLSLFLTFSRGPWVASFVSIFIYLLVYAKKAKSPSLFILKSFLLLSLLLLILFTPLGGNIHNRIIGTFDIESTMGPRIKTWSLALHDVYESILLGIGPGRAEQKRILFGKFTFEQSRPIIESGYFKILAELGLPGLIIFLTIIFSGLKKGYVKIFSSDEQIAFPIFLGFITIIFELLFIQAMSSWLTNMLFWLYLGYLFRIPIEG